MTAASIVYVLACAAIAWAGFCRMVRTDTGTLAAIRVVMWMLTVAALAAGAAVLVWRHVPRWPDVALATAIAAVQVVTAVLWRDGVPWQFRRSTQND